MLHWYKKIIYSLIQTWTLKRTHKPNKGKVGWVRKYICGDMFTWKWPYLPLGQYLRSSKQLELLQTCLKEDPLCTARMMWLHQKHKRLKFAKYPRNLELCSMVTWNKNFAFWQTKLKENNLYVNMVEAEVLWCCGAVFPPNPGNWIRLPLPGK